MEKAWIDKISTLTACGSIKLSFLILECVAGNPNIPAVAGSRGRQVIFYMIKYAVVSLVMLCVIHNMNMFRLCILCVLHVIQLFASDIT
jgi:hypothetical protein